MKVGIIVESGPQGADLQVLCYLVEQLVPGATVSPATFHNKKELVDKCGVAASRLLAEDCDKVLIVWDLYPAWREKNMRPDARIRCALGIPETQTGSRTPRANSASCFSSTLTVTTQTGPMRSPS